MIKKNKDERKEGALMLLNPVEQGLLFYAY